MQAVVRDNHSRSYKDTLIILLYYTAIFEPITDPLSLTSQCQGI